MGEPVFRGGPVRASRRPRAVGPVRTAPESRRPGEDSVDRHVARWRTWDVFDLDDDIEAVVTRVQLLEAYLARTTKRAVVEAGLQGHVYASLHRLMIRDTPGYATIGDLARSSRVSPATMTTRVDAMEAAGLVRRIPSEDDRRRVDVQVTDAGYDVWLDATRRRGAAERELFSALPAADRRGLVALPRTLPLVAEAADPPE